ncbi:hypothetical protein Sme01_24660 [Sphaerisporangium melleum]|uniref:Uncharacterized protein n=1 Tax=Sphaerisporangium melleum TaxID=321316 RepID=A0A917VDE0_9ACTN|nr:hypothetical protein [Sphaerisporangium melleum]GGK65176.1 hypothetical protein GCM10007964_05270 [Sphaerisporangium melleum]GII69990.1 hypothetical protein Sme01_24660 [Sphaerisporangium melleum]
MSEAPPSGGSGETGTSLVWGALLPAIPLIVGCVQLWVAARGQISVAITLVQYANITSMTFSVALDLLPWAVLAWLLVMAVTAGTGRRAPVHSTGLVLLAACYALLLLPMYAAWASPAAAMLLLGPAVRGAPLPVPLPSRGPAVVRAAGGAVRALPVAALAAAGLADLHALRYPVAPVTGAVLCGAALAAVALAGRIGTPPRAAAAFAAVAGVALMALSVPGIAWLPNERVGIGSPSTWVEPQEARVLALSDGWAVLFHTDGRVQHVRTDRIQYRVTCNDAGPATRLSASASIAGRVISLTAGPPPESPLCRTRKR